MARTSSITDQQQRRIAALAEQGVAPAGIVAALQRDGATASPRTLHRWVARVTSPAPHRSPPATPRPPPPKPPPMTYVGADVAPVASSPIVVTPQPEPDPPSEAELAALLETGDVDYLRGLRAQFAAALERWRPRLGVERAAVMSVRTLTAMIADLTRTIVELTPAPEAEAERLEALGLQQREALLARARAAAVSDEAAGLRRQVAAQAAMIDALAGGTARRNK